MTATAKIKSVEAAARAIHAYAVEEKPDLPVWDDVPADVRERYMDCAKRAVKAWKKAKKVQTP